MTERQLASVDVWKAASTDFCTMRHLAMRSEAYFSVELSQLSTHG
jgi:hypothetical protein